MYLGVRCSLWAWAVADACRTIVDTIVEVAVLTGELKSSRKRSAGAHL